LQKILHLHFSADLQQTAVKGLGLKRSPGREGLEMLRLRNDLIHGQLRSTEGMESGDNPSRKGLQISLRRAVSLLKRQRIFAEALQQASVLGIR